MEIQSLIYLLLFLFVITPLYVFLRIMYIRKKNKNIYFFREIGLFLFIASIFGILYFTILPNFLMVNEQLYITFKKEQHHNNIVPFKTIKNLISLLKNKRFFNYAFTNLFGNIFLFLPFSFLFYCLFNQFKGYQILFISLIFSIIIELLQIPMQRISDIDDVILNSLGSFLGVMIGFIILKFFQIQKRKSNT